MLTASTRCARVQHGSWLPLFLSSGSYQCIVNRLSSPRLRFFELRICSPNHSVITVAVSSIPSPTRIVLGTNSSVRVRTVDSSDGLLENLPLELKTGA
jgi:hypothetical protein